MSRRTKQFSLSSDKRPNYATVDLDEVVGVREQKYGFTVLHLRGGDAVTVVEPYEDVVAAVWPPAGETQETVAAWRRVTFGDKQDPATVAARLLGEAAELASLFSLGPDESAEATLLDQVRHECADVLVFLWGLADVMGFDLQAAANEKMAVNRKRQWRTDGKGGGQHR